MPLLKIKTFPIYLIGFPDLLRKTLVGYSKFLGFPITVVDNIPLFDEGDEECRLFMWFLADENLNFDLLQKKIKNLDPKVILVHFSNSENLQNITQLQNIGFHESINSRINLEDFEGLVKRWSITLNELFGIQNFAQIEILDLDLLKSRFEIESGLLPQLVEIYFREFPLLLAQFQKTIEDGKFDQIDALSHRLKGMAANLGAKRVSNIAVSFENLAIKANWEQMPALVTVLEDQAKETELEYHKLLKDPKKFLYSN
ncbi:MAG: Hpt domain-containing protein [SAR324 cluster bacterium]|nr:Hpt domain-containing protein [SAR324 cluster bacterium]